MYVEFTVKDYRGMLAKQTFSLDSNLRLDIVRDVIQDVMQYILKQLENSYNPNTRLHFYVDGSFVFSILEAREAIMEKLICGDLRRLYSNAAYTFEREYLAPYIPDDFL